MINEIKHVLKTKQLNLKYFTFLNIKQEYMN